MNIELDHLFTENSLKRNEEEKWLEWRKYYNKIDVIKSLVGLAHVLEVSGISLVSLYTRNHFVYLSVPAIVAINSYALKALDEKATKYWQENWIEPFRTINENPSRAIIDLEAVDFTYPRLKSKN